MSFRSHIEISVIEENYESIITKPLFFNSLYIEGSYDDQTFYTRVFYDPIYGM